MSDPTTEVTQEVAEGKEETPVEKAVKKISVKELLASISSGGSLKLLKERPVQMFLPDGESVVMLTVKELTKMQYDKLIAFNTRCLPEVPMIEQRYTQARQDPVTRAIKPAGSYMEPNPSDPAYMAASQRWFNDSAVLFGLFAAAQDFDLNLDLDSPELDNHIDERLAAITSKIPTPTLLDLAYEASLVNRGVPIAEQLIAAVEAAHANEARERAEFELGGTD